MKSLWKGHFLTGALLAADIIAFSLLWREGWELRRTLDPWFEQPINGLENYTRGILWKLLLMWIAVMAYFRHYRHQGKISSLNQIENILKAGLGLLIGTMAAAYLYKQHDIGRSVIFIAVGMMTIYVYASRSALRIVKQKFVERGFGLARVAIIGAGETGRKVARRIKCHPEVGYDLIGFIDRDPALRDAEVEGAPVIGDGTALNQLLLRHRIEEVFFALPNAKPNDAFNLITECEEARVHFKMVTANLLQVITNKVKIDDIEDLPVIPLRHGRLNPPEAILKRALDLAIALPSLLIAAPVMALVAVLIRLDSPGPAMFIQQRVGKNGKIFRMYKFRTMRTDADPYSEAPRDPTDPRITRFGAFLRRASLDELPQIMNVIEGSMSIVGPRPEMPFIVEKYEPWQRRRLFFPPGLTGLWQIAGRKRLPLHLNLEYDFYYIRNWSILLDLEIMIKTVPVVIFGHGAF